MTKTVNNTDFSVIEYDAVYEKELLHLLLMLHENYFRENAPLQVQELREEKEIERSYKNYLHQLHEINDDTWKTFLAVTGSNKITGFIIGSLTKDEELVKGMVGKIEDWYVAPEQREKGMGAELYSKLETWFIEKGCQQVSSDTWEGNGLSIKAHKQAGFFVSGVSFSKKLK